MCRLKRQHGVVGAGIGIMEIDVAEIDGAFRYGELGRAGFVCHDAGLVKHHREIVRLAERAVICWNIWESMLKRPVSELVYVNIMTSVPALMPNHALPAMNRNKPHHEHDERTRDRTGFHRATHALTVGGLDLLVGLLEDTLLVCLAPGCLHRQYISDGVRELAKRRSARRRLLH